MLLEKYDQKLDEMTEAVELKEIERLQLEEKLEIEENASPSKKSKESLKQKIDFLQQMLEKLQELKHERSISRSLISSRQGGACGTTVPPS